MRKLFTFILLLGFITLCVKAFAVGSRPHYELLTKCVDTNTGVGTSIKKCNTGNPRYVEEKICRDNVTLQNVDMSFCIK